MHTEIGNGFIALRYYLQALRTHATGLTWPEVSRS